MSPEKKLKTFLPLLILCWLITVSASCNKSRQREAAIRLRESEQEQKLREDLIRQNRDLVLEEQEAISAYIERLGIDSVTKTATGLHFRLLRKGTGRQARLLNRVELSYEAKLIDGKFCYSSDSTGRLKFILGQSEEPSGLQEAILKMKEGEKALVIIPSYLAHGVSGDGICVPGSTSMVYTIRLEKVSE